MTPEQETRIRKLAKDNAEATLYFRGMQMMNVAVDPTEAVKQAVEFAVAQAREMETRSALNAAMLALSAD